jgi:uncharacterized protein YgbK (DUF1537 family)
VVAPLLGAIADDATGATDLCSVLVREGMRAVQTIGVARDVELPETDAVVVSLKSRTAPVDDAVAWSLEALEWLRELGARQFFFKYCSTFDSTPDGNIGPVADALLDALESGITVVCPAYPTNGRTLYQGHLFVGDRLLSESSMARHPLTPMTDSNIVRVLREQTSRRVGLVPHAVVREGAAAVEHALDELRADGVAYAVTDALVDDDLRALGAACARLALVTGGAGIATGLPANFGIARGTAAQDAPVDGPAVVLAGSASDATGEQVRRMAARFPSFEVAPDADDEALAAAAAARMSEGPVLVHVPRERVAGAAEALEARIGSVARRLVAHGARRVVVAGGETSAAVVDALGVRALAVGREIAPGVPWMTVIGDPPLALALKSGNFGGPDFFLEALEVQ